MADYYEAEALSEQSKTGSGWAQKARLTFTPDSVGDWLVLVTFEMTLSSTSYYAGARVQVDDGATNRMAVFVEPTNISKLYDYKRFGSFFLLENLSVAEHYIDVDIMTEYAVQLLISKESVS